MNKLLKLASTKIGCGYVFGSQGEIMSQKRLNTLIKQQGISHYHLSNGTKAEKWLGKQCFDCSGLVIWCLTQLGVLPQGTDTTAQGLYDKYCTPITKDQLKEGDLVFIKGKTTGIVHVGIYVGNGKTVEAYGTAKGVVNGSIDRFNVFGRLKFDLDDKDDMTFENAMKIVADKVDTPYTYWMGKVNNKEVPESFKTLIMKIAKAMV